MIVHSLKNRGGTRSRPDNKVIYMLGLSVHATYAHIDLRTAFADCQIMAPVVTKLFDCKTAEEVANIAVPDKKWPRWFQRLLSFYPSPCLPQCNPHIRNQQAF